MILFRWGEPFLHPGLPDMARAAQEAGIFVLVSSNLNHFSREMARRIVASGLYRLYVSIDGATQPVYEVSRRGGRLLSALRHVRWIQREMRRQGRSSPRLVWLFVVFRHNESELPKARDMARRLGISFEAKPGTARPGDGLQECSPGFDRRELSPAQTDSDYCSALWLGPAIHADGSVLPCCIASDERFSFGNVFAEPFSGIWNNRKYRAARRSVCGLPADPGVEIPCTACPHHPRGRQSRP
jgi:MoaA/NifB/PqqE/SkfB family radical SAM enzyme